MEIYVNDVQTDEIREEERDGDKYLVAPVRFIKNMRLHRGYVPKQEIVEATEDWEETPVVVGHPTNRAGRPVSINAEAANDVPEVGFITNPTTVVNGEAATEGELWYNLDKARELGGDAEKIAANLRFGVSHAVSSAYGGKKLPPGEYDGEEHQEVMGNLRPDHVAILPDNTGRCKIEDGCVAGEVAANDGEVYVNAIPDDSVSPENGQDEGQTTMPSAFNALSQARTPEYDGTTSSSWSAPSFSDYDVDGDSVEDLSADDRSFIASHTLLGDPDADTFDDLQVFPVVEPGSRNLNENALDAVLSGRGAQADIPESALESARAVATTLLEEEFDRDLSANTESWAFLGKLFADKFGLGVLATNESPAESGEEDEPHMSEKTQELVDDHGFNAENLPDEDTECFNRIYERFATNEEEEEEAEAGDGGEEEEVAEEETSTESGEETVELTEEELESRIQARVDERIDEAVDEALAANREREEKEDLVDTIVANSEEYGDDDRDDLLESPRSVLEKLADNIPSPQGHADHRARRGASSPSAGSGSDGSGMPALSANARIAEKEAGDD